MNNLFPNIRKISDVAINILKKRYFHDGETTWDEVVDRVIKHVLVNADDEQRELTREMILNRYFIPNSPCLFNANKKNSGLVACFVLDFKDSIEDIYKTKLDFALIAKKGGGCGTTLTKIRPKGSPVSNSAHGYAGGPVAFYNTICTDMDVITQTGVRSMAMMGTYSVYGPDIAEFITAKQTEGVMANTNISVMVDNAFMEKVEKDETYWTEFNGVKYQEYKAREIFDMIVESAWRNGEPGILFYDKINTNTPYKYSGQEILATNPCVTGDTKILTVYDGAKSFSELANDNKDVLIYTWNPETKLPEVSLMRNPRKTRENAPIMEVEFDSGLKVKCTYDHNFYTFTGHKAKAVDLQPGQSIRAFSVSVHRDGHIRMHGWRNGKAKHVYLARAIWEFYNGKIPNEFVLHHKDFDEQNNRLENFQLLTKGEHNRVHYPHRRSRGFVRGKNHKVISVRECGYDDVYNGTVDNTHTYIIADDNPIAGIYSGIVSANCGKRLPQ